MAGHACYKTPLSFLFFFFFAEIIVILKSCTASSEYVFHGSRFCKSWMHRLGLLQIAAYSVPFRSRDLQSNVVKRSMKNNNLILFIAIRRRISKAKQNDAGSGVGVGSLLVCMYIQYILVLVHVHTSAYVCISYDLGGIQLEQTCN